MNLRPRDPVAGKATLTGAEHFAFTAQLKILFSNAKTASVVSRMTFNRAADISRNGS